MKIPTVALPTYSLKLISTGKEISFRPFLVKEEKLLLLAATSQDQEDILSTILQVINNCIISPKDLDVSSLPVFDIKFILLNLRIRSIGNSVEIDYKCNNRVNDEVCGHAFTVNYGLEEISIEGDGKEGKIMIGPNLGVLMRPPTFKATMSIKSDDPNELLFDSIYKVFDDKTTYSFSDLTHDEKVEWIESLPQKEFDKLASYLAGLPKMEVNKTHVCESCGFEHKISIRDFTSFF